MSINLKEVDTDLLNELIEETKTRTEAICKKKFTTMEEREKDH